MKINKHIGELEYVINSVKNENGKDECKYVWNKIKLVVLE